MKRLTRLALGIILILLGLIGFILPKLQAFFLFLLGALILWSDIKNVLGLLDTIEKYFPRSKDRVQRLRQSLVEER